MTNTTRIAALGLAALLLTTAGAHAFGARESVGESVADSIGDAIDTDQAQDAGDNLQDAIDTDEARDVDENLHDKIVFFNNENMNDIMLGSNGKLDMKQALAAGLLKLTCLVDDDALIITNNGSLALPAKTKLRWTVAALGEVGTLKLSTELAAGARARTAEVVAGADGESCAIKVLGH
ncbi:hypothetical protein [Devosia sp. CN2-171]|uniref:hypothetical protein n=1 Tax=Devosia sp. CN2-171 TaxID=3400909 RepID=UPI003BF7D38A